MIHCLSSLTAVWVYDWQVHPADVVILEGILTLFWDDLKVWRKLLLRFPAPAPLTGCWQNMMALKLFVDTASDTRLARRILRDTRERGAVLLSIFSPLLPSLSSFLFFLPFC